MAFLPKYTFTFFYYPLESEEGAGEVQEGAQSCNDERGQRWRDEKAIKWKWTKRERWEEERGVKDHRWRRKQKQRENKGEMEWIIQLLHFQVSNKSLAYIYCPWFCDLNSHFSCSLLFFLLLYSQFQTNDCIIDWHKNDFLCSFVTVHHNLPPASWAI